MVIYRFTLKCFFSFYSSALLLKSSVVYKHLAWNDAVYLSVLFSYSVSIQYSEEIKDQSKSATVKTKNY